MGCLYRVSDLSSHGILIEGILIEGILIEGILIEGILIEGILIVNNFKKTFTPTAASMWVKRSRKDISSTLAPEWVKTALPHPTDKVNRKIEISENSIKIIILSRNPI